MSKKIKIPIANQNKKCYNIIYNLKTIIKDTINKVKSLESQMYAEILAE